MSLFANNQQLTIRLPESMVPTPGSFEGQLLFQSDREVAVRIQSGPELAELTAQVERLSKHGSIVQIEYRQGNYLCSFETRFDLVADRSLPVTLLLIMPMPGTIRRVLDPA